MSTINLEKNLEHHSKTKNIEMKHRFIRNHMTRGDIILNYVESKSNLADIVTKPLFKVEFATLIRDLGIVSLTRFVAIDMQDSIELIGTIPFVTSHKE